MNIPTKAADSNMQREGGIRWLFVKILNRWLIDSCQRHAKRVLGASDCCQWVKKHVLDASDSCQWVEKRVLHASDSCQRVTPPILLRGNDQ